MAPLRLREQEAWVRRGTARPRLCSCLTRCDASCGTGRGGQTLPNIGMKPAMRQE